MTASAPPSPAQDRLAVPLAGGFTWQQRLNPDCDRFDEWRRLLASEGATVDSWAVLLAAYDGGWDVVDGDGQPVPSPRQLDVRGYNVVPLATVESLIDHVAAQAWVCLRSRLTTPDPGSEPAPSAEPPASPWGLAGEPDWEAMCMTPRGGA